MNGSLLTHLSALLKELREKIAAVLRSDPGNDLRLMVHTGISQQLKQRKYSTCLGVGRAEYNQRKA